MKKKLLSTEIKLSFYEFSTAKCGYDEGDFNICHKFCISIKLLINILQDRCWQGMAKMREISYLV